MSVRKNISFTVLLILCVSLRMQIGLLITDYYLLYFSVVPLTHINMIICICPVLSP